MLAGLTFALYGLCVLCVFVYALGYYHLLYRYWAGRKRAHVAAAQVVGRTWPSVTVQLPLYNERYVAAELIDACAAMNYPRDKFDIQVLDDSNDETVQVVDERAAYWRTKGVEVNAVRRATRSGFKAGALMEATPKAKGELIAMFDADFRPKADFLEQMVPEFDDAKVAAVQARWGHLNREYSILTVAQSLLHDAFFFVEQEARARSGYFIRFNGSAGMWRRAAIEDAGGWSADTLCEDMDLAYRAQLKGWRMVYRRDVVAPAELPVTIADYYTQQHRWHKGRTQVIRKIVGLTWRTPLPPVLKAHAFFDQLNAVVVPGVLLLALGGPFFYMATQGNPWMLETAKWFNLANINVLLLPAFAWISLRAYAPSPAARVFELIRTVPALVLLFLGMNFALTMALLQGLFDSKAEFRRTAKYRVDASSPGQAWKGTAYAPRRDLAITYGSLALSVLFAGYVIFDLSAGLVSMTLFHSAMALSNAMVGIRAWARA